MWGKGHMECRERAQETGVRGVQEKEHAVQGEQRGKGARC